MPRSAPVLAFAVATLASAGAFGHHGWSSYEGDEVVELTGIVQELTRENPHGMLMLEAEGEVWHVVLPPPFRMQSRGLTDDAVREGGTVTVRGHVHRRDPSELRATEIEANGAVLRLR